MRPIRNGTEYCNMAVKEQKIKLLLFLLDNDAFGIDERFSDLIDELKKAKEVAFNLRLNYDKVIK